MPFAKVRSRRPHNRDRVPSASGGGLGRELRLAVIGTGAIASYLAEAIHAGRAGAARVVALADTEMMRDRLESAASRHGCACSTDIMDLPEHGPDIVIEAATPQVVRDYAIPLLDAGVDLLVMSAGALVDDGFVSELHVASQATRRRVYVPSGAVGGLDIVRAAAIDGIEEARLTTSKPPDGLAGAPWFEEHPIDLTAITERTVIFRGSVSEAVRWFPKNVNVAAVLYLAAIDSCPVCVEVVIDPTSNRNVHELYVRGTFGDMTLRVSNVPSTQNPKTSQLACLSPLALLRQLSSQIVVGS
jgi:aspartate dehydrogenase